MFVYPHFCVHPDSHESGGDSVIDATATNALHPLRDKAFVARHTIHKPAELSKSCVLDTFDESNASGGETEKRRAGARSSAVTPREPAVKAGLPGLESGVFVEIVGCYPVREAGAGRPLEPDRWPTNASRVPRDTERCCCSQFRIDV